MSGRWVRERATFDKLGQNCASALTLTAAEYADETTRQLAEETLRDAHRHRFPHATGRTREQWRWEE